MACDYVASEHFISNNFTARSCMALAFHYVLRLKVAI